MSSLELWDDSGRLGFLPSASNVRVREVLNGEYYVIFRYPKLHADERYELLEIGNEIHFSENVENGQQFTIWKTEERQAAGRIYKDVEAHHVAFGLGRTYYDDFIDFEAGQTAEVMLTRLFAGTGITFEISGIFGIRDIFDWGEKSRLALLHELRDIYGAELSWDNKTLTFTRRKGGESGQQIRYRKNQRSIRRTVQDTDRITRLYGYGKDGLTIEGHAGHTVKYIDSTYYNPARPFEGKMSWPEIDDQDRLLAAMQQYLADNELPSEKYDVETLQLPGVGVGDEVTVINEQLGYNLTARVYEHERYPFQRSQPPRFILGNFRDRYISDYLLQYRRKQREYQSLVDRRTLELEQQQSELEQAQLDFEDYVETSFADGIISEAEQQIIAEHKLSLAKEKADVDAEYSKIYNSLYLVNTTLKAALLAAKNNYDSSYTALITAIDTAISDSGITPVERADVNDKFVDLTKKLATLRQALQDSWASITQTGLDAIAGKGIHAGGVIRLENRTHSVNKTLLTAAVGSGATTINVVSTAGFPESGSLYINDTRNPAFWGFTEEFSYTGKTATSFIGVSGIGTDYLATGSVFMWTRPFADIVVTSAEVIMPDGTYKIIPETRFNSQQLGASGGDADGWEFKYLFIDNSGMVRLASTGTSAGINTYPPNPPEGSLRIGYLLIGYGGEDPNGDLGISKEFDANGYPIFKERIYLDTRYRDERSVRADGSDVAFGGTPYGAQTLAVTCGPRSYQTYYVPVGKGRRSLNLSLSLDDGSGYDNYNYGAQLTVGRKAANNADGMGRSIWATYTDADNTRGHVSGQRNTSPYGIHVLSPRVWGRSYTMLYDVDLTPDPTDGAIVALKLTFYNYHASASESFNLKLNWHAL
ncbi:phage tail spike protein [Paenibacillus sp. GXUN7292]|uniref:phage tail spike protein n=1 Tax=Paenibacillus sp. GXUN7292 TaxID=3422499 RepID=UPI003D7D8CE2